MKEYTLETMEVGLEEGFEVVVTQNMQDAFTGLTGDVNPMHLSSEYAIEHGFRDKLVYGMLTAAYYSRLVGVYLPGRYCLLQECNTRFHKPVYLEDRLSVRGKVTEINKVLNRVTIKASVTNQNGETVSKAAIIVGVMKAEDRR